MANVNYTEKHLNFLRKDMAKFTKSAEDLGRKVEMSLKDMGTIFEFEFRDDANSYFGFRHTDSHVLLMVVDAYLEGYLDGIKPF